MFDTKIALEQFNALSDVARKRLSSALDSIEHGISPNMVFHLIQMPFMI